jgi:hypothetical protein
MQLGMAVWGRRSALASRVGAGLIPALFPIGIEGTQLLTL